MRGTPSRELHDGRTESSLAKLVSGSILKRLHCQYTITHHNHHAHNDHTMYHLCHTPLLLLSLHKPRQGPHLTLTAASGLGNQTNKDHTRVRIIGGPDPVSVVCWSAAPRFLRRRVFPQINLPPTHKCSAVSTFHHSTPLSPKHQSKTLVKHRSAHHHHHQKQQQPQQYDLGTTWTAS